MPRVSDHARYVTPDPNPERFHLYRLCDCTACGGIGKVIANLGPETRRCLDCRGEGRIRELVATAGNPEAVGVALVTLGREHEWDECPVGILDTEGEVDHKWVLRPWLPSARNVRDAAKLMRAQQ